MKKTKTAAAVRRPKKTSTALARRAAHAAELMDATPMGVITKLARDPRLTVEKFERLIAVTERMQARDAAQQYEMAFSAMEPMIPVITKRGIITNKAGEVQSTFARFEDIQRVVRPILRAHGFTLKYHTEWPLPGVLEVIGTLTHRAGHSQESRFRSPADDTGGKNKIQGLGSANSYGRRYTVIDLLNIVTEGADDDGKRAVEIEKKLEERGPVVSDTKVHVPEVVPPSKTGKVLTDKQLRSLISKAENSGREPKEISDWLKRRYQVSKSSQIDQADFSDICAAIEGPGDL